jgi:hypothetical protein
MSMPGMLWVSLPSAWTVKVFGFHSQGKCTTAERPPEGAVAVVSCTAGH